MLYDETAVKANIRNREGRRVFFLGKEDRLTPSARDWLNRERIAILSGDDARSPATGWLAAASARKNRST